MSFADPIAHWLRRNHAFAFLGASALLILLSPFAAHQEGVAIAEVFLLGLAVLTASMSLSLSGWRFLTICATAMLWFVLRLLELMQFLTPASPRFVFAVLSGGIFLRLVNDLMRARRANLATLASALSGILMLGIFWAQLYGLTLSLAGPSALSPAITTDDQGTLLYFSFSTLATLGYGDIVPVHPMARMLSVFEALAGMFYNAVVIARLVALYSDLPGADTDAHVGTARESRPVTPKPPRYVASEDEPIN